MASWFYLTLWRGNPPEMTESIDVTVNTKDGQSVEVIQTSIHNGTVQTGNKFEVVIRETDQSNSTVEERNEVIWVVGKKH